MIKLGMTELWSESYICFPIRDVIRMSSWDESYRSLNSFMAVSTLILRP